VFMYLGCRGFLGTAAAKTGLTSYMHQRDPWMWTRLPLYMPRFTEWSMLTETKVADTTA
jgi:hypothetical protein